MRWVLPTALLVVLLAAVLLPPPASAEGTWIPSKPQGLFETHGYEDGVLILRISLIFKHAGFNVTWRGAEIVDNEIRIYVDVYEWTGPAAQVVTMKSRVFRLAAEPGVYRLVLVVNGEPWKQDLLYLGVDPPITLSISTVTHAVTLSSSAPPTPATRSATGCGCSAAYTGNSDLGSFDPTPLVAVGLVAVVAAVLILGRAGRR